MTCVVLIGLSNPARFVIRCARVAAVLALALSPATAVAHGAVLRGPTSADPTTLDVELAVAVTPYGTTRWTRLTVGGPPSVLWLVPARPGAALDWATSGWLTTLEGVTTPRVAPPTATPPCNMPAAAERIAPWSSIATEKFPSAVVLLDSIGNARSHVASRGYAMSADVDAKVADLYARGSSLVALEFAGGAGATLSSPTLRISDDGAPVVPLALTGSASTPVHVTAIVFASGAAALPGTRELDPSAITWGRNYSTFSDARASALVTGGGAIWVRESASHAVLFDGVPVPRDTPITPLSTGYFKEANGQARPTCDAAARDASVASGTVGRWCAAGALARVPGGPTCTPTTTPIDPTAFNCGPGVDDLALALAGASPAATVVTRFTGVVAAKSLGFDAAITSAASTLSPVVYAGSYEPCPVPINPPKGGSSSGGATTPPLQALPAGNDDRPSHYRRSDSGCSGSSTVIVYDDTGDEAPVADEGCGGTSSTGTDNPTSSDTSGDNCGSSSTSSSSSSSSSTSSSSSSSSSSSTSSSTSSSSSSSSSSTSSSGWDESDKEDDSSKSDSCDCGKSSTGSSTSSSSSGDDTTGAAPKSVKPQLSAPAKSFPKKTSSNTVKHRGPSPVSRYALLFVALVLPLRRRLRVTKL